MIELTAPRYLLLLLLLPPLLWFTYQVDADRRRQHVIRLGLRAVILGLLCLSLAGPTIVRRSSRGERMVVVAYDVSASVGDAAVDVATQWHASLMQNAPPVRATLLPFASTPDSPARAATRATEKDAAWALETDISAAIQAAVATSSDVTDIVVITDGNETRGDAVYAAERAGMPVSVVALQASTRNEVQLAALEIPRIVREAQPFAIGVKILATTAASGQVKVYEGQRLIASEAVELEAGENQFQLQHALDHTRITELQVRLVGFEDEYEANNQRSTLLRARPKPHVLVLDPQPEEMQSFSKALQAQGIRITRCGPETLSDEANELVDFEAVVLSNVAATDLSAGQLKALQDYVRESGGGLLMLGGDRSFGLGGYTATPLAGVLPVHCDYERQDEMPSLAIVLAIDRSSSMMGMKLEMAREAAIAAAELLEDRDLLGIIAFDAASRWVTQLGPATAAKEVTMESVTAAGGTAIQPALIAAQEALIVTDAALKHVVLLTDGHSVPADWEPLIARMVQDRITLSTVAVGASSDQAMLERLARLGGGRHYFCVDPQTVPQVFAQETIIASMSALDENPFRPRVTRASAVLRGVDWENVPPLYGYVRTRPKATAELVLTSEPAVPILAWCRVGLGKTVAFTSDAKPRWAKDWLAWPDYGRFWAQVIRYALRDTTNQSSELRAQRQANKIVVQLDVTDANLGFGNAAIAYVDMTRPDRTRQRLPLNLVAPGRYQTVLAPASAAAYHFAAVELVGERMVNIADQSVVSSYPQELSIRVSDTKRLQQVAAVSGGQFNPDPTKLLGKPLQPLRRPYELTPLLLSLCLLLFVIDVTARRLTWAG